MMLTSFSKLSWELSLGDFHLCLMWPCDSALFPRRPFTVTWDKPLYFFFCHAALKEIYILWSIKKKQKKKKTRTSSCTYDTWTFFVFKSVLSRKETIWYCCAPRYPPWYRSTKVSSNVLNNVLIMHLEHLALWPFILKSHYSSGLHGYKALSALFFYYILIALDGGKGRTWTST